MEKRHYITAENINAHGGTAGGGHGEGGGHHDGGYFEGGLLGGGAVLNVYEPYPMYPTLAYYPYGTQSTCNPKKDRCPNPVSGAWTADGININGDNGIEQFSNPHVIRLLSCDGCTTCPCKNKK